MSNLNIGGPQPTPTVAPLNVTSTIRILLIALGSAGLVKTGVIGNDQLQTIVSALMIIGSVGWTYYKNHRVTAQLKTAMTAPAVRLMSNVLAALLLIGFIAPGLTACGAIGALNPPPATSVILLKADTSLDASYDTALQAYIKVAPVLPASVKAQARLIIPQALKAVQAADQAESTADATNLQAQITAAQGLIAQISAIASGAAAGSAAH